MYLVIVSGDGKEEKRTAQTLEEAAIVIETLAFSGQYKDYEIKIKNPKQ